MNKITLTLFLSITSLSSYASNLSIIDNSAPDKTIVTVPLQSLEINKFYKVTCDINNVKQDAKVLFAPRLLSSSTYGSVKFNEDLKPNNSAKLKQGKNQLSFLIRFNQKDTEEYNQFTLNGSSDSFEVEQCRAEEESPADLKTKKLLSGYFNVYNYTGHLVQFSVGNFFPTPYTVYPHDSTWVSVSTDNQDFRIDNIY